MRYRRATLVAAVTLLLLVAPLAIAQSATGSIQGVVNNPGGGAIPNASLILRGAGEDTQKTVSVLDGKYAFANLPPGVYKLTASGAGLTTAAYEKIVVEPGRATVLKVRLDIGLLDVEVNAGLDTSGVYFLSPLPGYARVPLCDLFPDALTMVWTGSTYTFRIGELDRKAKERAAQALEAPKVPAP